MSIKTVAYNAKHAFDPAASVFVSANAGAGKTSLLTNRVLALLLSGIDPSKLLCLTYTNAAAAEMSTRILEKLGDWVMADDTHLSQELEKLISQTPAKHQLVFARSLFAKVLEAPDGVRIQTIHSFCQSLLRRFPIEAGVSPHFTLIDSRSEQELLKEARLRLFNRAQTEDPRLQESLNAIASMLSESSFHSLMSEVIKNKRRIRSLFFTSDGMQRAEDVVYELLKTPKEASKDTLLIQHLSYDEDNKKKLREVCARILLSEAKTDQETGQSLAAWLESDCKGEDVRDAYIKRYYNKDGAKRERLYTKKTLTQQADIDLMAQEQERIFGYVMACRALETAKRTRHVLCIADALLSLYEKLKSNHALMDYDDLILTARDLLQKPDIAPWVLFKLDGGIDHILVDEAQDTSPEQWEIVESLTEEFFSGLGSREQDRSLFVVGDEKQSIYSFQGAAPKALGEKEQVFSQRITDVAKPFHKIQLRDSYRSTTKVLEAIDSIFSNDAAKAGLMFSNDILKHTPTRGGYEGLVELWPLSEAIKENNEVVVSAKTVLARRIADTIAGWLKDGLMLESQGRPVNAGDIMILIRKRSVLVDYLVRALKRNNVPVAGHDRMKLGDNLAVMDLIALGQCLLLPEDNLTLASLLKSPIFSISEDTLLYLCSTRGKNSLWAQLHDVAGKNPDVAHAYQLLSALRAKVDFVSPYELFSYVLDSLGARKRFLGRMGEEYNDALDEFLGQALLFERSHTASMQGFLSWLAASDSEIKRDMEKAKGCIRIMTVHGAKGLQAPIVILPDTVDAPQSKDTLLWYNTPHGSLPFWSASAKSRDEFSAVLAEDLKQSMQGEFRRLLYVALTRAEDCLYIAGFSGDKKLSEQSWYHHVEAGLRPLATPFEMGTGQGLRVGTLPSVSKNSASTDRVGGDSIKSQQDFTFLGMPVPADPVPSQPLVPSRQSGDEPPSASPLSGADANIFMRGNCIHMLLQYLPQVSVQDRPQVIAAITSGYRHCLSDAVIAECVDEVLQVIHDPKFSHLFEAGALTEVPITGNVTINGQVVTISGQIDRLCITDKDVWIIDYKSNRLTPKDSSAIPASYLKQMALYRHLLKKIYPEKNIRCALLWTYNASITPLDEALLSSYI